MANYLRTRTSLLAIILSLLVSNVYAADKVVVVPLIGDTNYLIEPANLVDFFVDFNSTPDTVTAYTVPDDKVFVLTDMDGIACTPDVILSENSTTKLQIRFGTGSDGVVSTSKSFRSGITFSSGSNVNLALVNRPQGLCKLTLMGYLH